MPQNFQLNQYGSTDRKLVMDGIPVDASQGGIIFEKIQGRVCLTNLKTFGSFLS